MKLTREQLIDRINAMPDAKAIVQGYYVADDRDRGEPTGGEEFCEAHADALAWWYSLENGCETWISPTSMGSDGARRCAFGVCDLPLDCGPLTEDGVDSAIALTETKPLEAHCYAAELAQASEAMMPDDPRWVTWDAQARRLIRSRR